MRVDHVRFTSASPDLRDQGLLGWVELHINDRLLVADIALRRTLDGRLTLSFPKRRDARGHQRALIRPLNDLDRQAIERQVFSALRLDEVAR